MTYFEFLVIFLGLPLIFLSGLMGYDARQKRHLPDTLRNWPLAVALMGHVAVALIYTTPWDNYLVAHRVWWYDPQLVTGIVWGWVPVEEYTFFVLQPLLTGLWLICLARRIEPGPALSSDYGQMRRWLIGLLGLVWLGVASMLIAGWSPGTYLALELVWALPPIMMQLGFGADILWRHRRLVLLSWLPITLYLSAADALAIGSGTWSINPALSLNIYIGGVLPLEEMVFFAVTNILVTFGLVLVLSRQSQARFERLWNRRPLGLLVSENR
ncbi:MAG: lycopene cyclase domain-containing protein [Anaerolineae bacterium]|nr:lycopene cyclase domain-containing protein [Anaerolineae bacterium]